MGEKCLDYKLLETQDMNQAGVPLLVEEGGVVLFVAVVSSCIYIISLYGQQRRF